MPMRPARLLLRGGTVVSPGALPAQAMLVVDGVVAWVGADAAAPPAGPETAVVDLAGRLVTPGFVDAHVHVSATGLALTSVDLRSAGDRDAMLAALARGAASTTDAVLLAQGWDESRWPDPRLPSQRELDEAVGDIAVYASRVDSHSAVISTSLARRCAGIERADGWSGDGRVEREAHHQARAVANDLVPDHARAEAIRAALRHAAALGITAVHELNAPHLAPPGDFARIAAVTSSEPLPEVVGYWDSLDRTPPAGSTVRGFAGDLCADGAIGSRTAALAAPYADADTAGHLYIDRARVRDHVAGCTREGTRRGSTSSATAPWRRSPPVSGQRRAWWGRRRCERRATASSMSRCRATPTSRRWPSSASSRACNRPSTPRGARPARCTTSGSAGVAPGP